MSETREIDSPLLEGVRTLQLDPGDGPVCLFLDGDFYRDRIGIPRELGHLRAATLTGGGGENRHRDFSCSDGFVAFLVETVLPHFGGEVGLLVGVSLSGLAALHLAVERPDLFPRVVAQSPSAWWNDEALAARVARAGGAPSRAWISVGTEETDTAREGLRPSRVGGRGESADVSGPVRGVPCCADGCRRPTGRRVRRDGPVLVGKTHVRPAIPYRFDSRSRWVWRGVPRDRARE